MYWFEFQGTIDLTKSFRIYNIPMYFCLALGSFAQRNEIFQNGLFWACFNQQNGSFLETRNPFRFTQQNVESST